MDLNEQLRNACQYGDTPTVIKLLKDPRIDINKRGILISDLIQFQ